MEYAAAVDIGGTNIKYGLVNSDGEVIFKNEQSSEAQKGADHLMGIVKSVISEILEEAGARKVAGIGIASAGQIETGTGKVLFATSSLPGYTGVNVKKTVEDEFGLYTVVENDVNAVGVGEVWKGAGVGASRVLFMTLGTGIGGCIMVDGKVDHGSRGSAGEVGHFVIRHNGHKCSCGNRGCFEQYASTIALLRNYRSRLEDPPGGAACEGAINGITIFRLARAGDKKAQAALREFVNYLGSGIVSLVHILNPELVIIGGGICNEGEYLFGKVRKYVEKHAMPPFYEGLRIMPAMLGNTAGMIGATKLVFDGMP